MASVKVLDIEEDTSVMLESDWMAKMQAILRLSQMVLFLPPMIGLDDLPRPIWLNVDLQNHLNFGHL